MTSWQLGNPAIWNRWLSRHRRDCRVAYLQPSLQLGYPALALGDHGGSRFSSDRGCGDAHSALAHFFGSRWRHPLPGSERHRV